MASEPEMPRNKRNFLAGVAMLAVLLLTTAAAWVLVSTRGADRRRGAAVLSDIRRQMLPALWGDEPREAWYLRTDPDGKSLGWWRSLRYRTADGYLGREQVVLEDGTQWRENWRIDDAAARGRYVFNAVGRKLPAGFLDVSIAMEEGKVAVASSEWPQSVIALAPPQYVPEGLLELVAYIAGRRGQTIACDSIANEAAIQGGQVLFMTFAMEPQQQAGEGVISVAVRGAGSERLFVFDKTGGVQRVEHRGDGTAWVQVTREKVGQSYPEVLRMGRPGEASQEQPGEEPEGPAEDEGEGWEGIEDIEPEAVPAPPTI